jgi:Leucine Rich repeat
MGDDIEQVFRDINNNPHVFLSNRNIGTDGAVRLANLLSSNNVWIELDLSGNGIGSVGSLEIGNALVRNDSLSILHLARNGIDNAGVGRASENPRSGLAHALSTPHTGLTELVLDQNGIEEDGVKELAEALKDNVRLERLRLAENKIATAGALELAVLLTRNMTVSFLDLQRTGIDDMGAIAIASLIATNTTITGLDLRNNEIGDEGAEAIERFLSRNSKLSFLAMDGNRIPQARLDDIARLTEANERRVPENIPDMGVLTSILAVAYDIPDVARGFLDSIALAKLSLYASEHPVPFSASYLEKCTRYFTRPQLGFGGCGEAFLAIDPNVDIQHQQFVVKKPRWRSDRVGREAGQERYRIVNSATCEVQVSVSTEERNCASHVLLMRLFAVS